MIRFPFLGWSQIHQGATAWNEAQEALFCDLPVGVELAPELAEVGDPLFSMDAPWELDRNLEWACALWDNERIRLWYTLSGLPDERKVGQLVCYAESPSGDEWTKPELGWVEVEGSTENNVVSVGTPSFCIMRTPHESPEKRYRATYHRAWWEDDAGTVIPSEEGLRRLRHNNAAGREEDKIPTSLKMALYAMDSPDGLRWSTGYGPILDEWHDTHNVCAYDPHLERYRFYLRGFYGGRRAVSYTESDTLERFPGSRILFGPGPCDRPDESIYSNAYCTYPGRPDLHLMFPGIYRMTEDDTYGQFAVSVDGYLWERHTGTISIAPRTEDRGGVYPEPSLIRDSGNHRFRLLLRCEGGAHNTGYNPAIAAKTRKKGCLRWADWPEDRLCGIRAPGDGQFTTKLLPMGRKLLANYKTESDGWIEFELVDRLTWPPTRVSGVQRFRFRECTRLVGDDLDKPVVWNGSPNLGSVGPRCAVRVRMHRATLYSLAVEGVSTPTGEPDPRYPV